MKDTVVVSDERVVYKIIERPGNIVMLADASRTMDGFVSDTFSEYRNRSVLRERLHCRTETPSTLGFTNRFTGNYYFAVAMQDSAAGEEPFEVWVGDRELAELCAGDNDNRVHLFVARERLRLKGGELFRLTTAANGRPYRIESLVLLKRLPTATDLRRRAKPPQLPRPKRREGVKAATVPLTILGRPGVQAESFPLTTGIPLPMGRLYDARRVALSDDSGRPVSLQTQVNGLWPDGSVRWLLVDFQHEVGREDRVVHLRYGRNVARSHPGRKLAKRTETGVTINTGAATLEIPDRDLALPGRVALNGAQAIPAVEAGIELKTADGKVYRSKREVTRLEIEENGPLRAVVKVECSHVDKRGRRMFQSSARIHAYAGKAWSRVAYTFTNDNTDETFTQVRELKLRVPLSKPPKTRKLIRQDWDNHFTVTEGNEVVRTGRRSDGVVAAESGEATAIVGVKDFWQNYPKALAVGPKGIEVGICPDVSDVDYRVGGYEEDRLYYYLGDGSYKLKCGMSRTHDIFFGFAPSGDSAKLRREVKAFLAAPLARAEPNIYLRSGVADYLTPKGQDAYERFVDHAIECYRSDRKKARAYGMMNYGDWFGERRYNWGNMEYDTPWVFLNEYLRGGEREWFELGAQAAAHIVDVDTCHAAPDAGAVGGQYAHCMGHVGGYYPIGYREMASATGGMSHTHTWVEGLFLYYGLTGDRRALENAKATCDRMAAYVDPRSYDFTNCRDAGWLLIHLCAALRATNEKRYLRAAHTVVERVLERQRESGGWERLMVPGHCFCDPPRHTGNASFMVGILMAGLRRYHQITKDPRVRKCIVRAAHYIIDANWVPEVKIFRYTQCPHSSKSVGQNDQMIEGLGYAWRLSKSPKIARVLIDTVECCLQRDPGGMGKSVSCWMRQAPFALRDYVAAVSRPQNES